MNLAPYRAAKRIAFDLETTDPGLKEHGPGGFRQHGEILGVALATDDHSEYVSFRHLPGTNNTEPEKAKAFLEDVLCRTECPKLAFNGLYDLEWLRGEMHLDPKGPILDPMVLGALTNENRPSQSLNALAKEYLGESKEETGIQEYADKYKIKDPKGSLALIPGDLVGEYARQDAALLPKLYDALLRAAKEEHLERVFQLEMDLYPVLLDMRFRGVRIDEEYAHQVKDQLSLELEMLRDRLNKLAGQQVEPYAVTSLSSACDKLGIWYPRTEKGVPSFRKSWLEAHESDFLQCITEVRQMDKIVNTFLDQNILAKVYNGRIHTNYHSVRREEGGTVSGRFSSSNPNLQQIPSRHPRYGKLLRKIFLPEPGDQWVKLDYSAQEPRIMVHYASLMKLPGVIKVVDSYRKDPRTDFHQKIADMAGITRSQAKTIGLGISYGMGKAKLAKSLELSIPEAEAVLSRYHELVPFMRKLTRTCSDLAGSRGWVRTSLGRRSHFNMWWSMEYREGQRPLPLEEAKKAWPGEGLRRADGYKALNRVIQGTAADMTKLALLECRRQGLDVLLTVHDEIDISGGSKEAELGRKIMEEVLPLEIPVIVDPEIGPSWGELSKGQDS